MDVLDIASRQHGLVTLQQARAAGYSKGEVATMLRRHLWVPRHARVYAVRGAPSTAAQALMAAVLAGGRFAMGSHRAAAWAVGLTAHPQIPEISIPTESRCRAHGVRVHRLGDLSLTKAEDRFGIPVTPPARCLVDLGAVLPVRRVQVALDRGIANRIVTPMSALAELERLSRKGRRGAGALRALLTAAGVTGSHPPSVLEAKTRRLIRRAGLPQPECELVVGQFGEYRLDFVWPELLLCLEVEGWQYHSSFAAFHAGMTRQNALTIQGFSFLRYSWVHVVRTPSSVVTELRGVLRSRRAVLPR